MRELYVSSDAALSEPPICQHCAERRHERCTDRVGYVVLQSTTMLGAGPRASFCCCQPRVVTGSTPAFPGEIEMQPQTAVEAANAIADSMRQARADGNFDALACYALVLR